MNPTIDIIKMKAQVLEEFGKPLVLKEIEKPKPKDHEVLVKIKASGLNPLDIKIKNGEAPHAQVTPPMILGIDMAGIIVEVGKDVHSFKMDDEVFGMVGGVGNQQGTLAEYIAVNPDLLSLKPKNIPFEDAAAISLVFITAWEALVDKINLQPNQTVLIHGGAGGVGHIAVQIAVAKGAKVYTTVQPHHYQQIKSYGAQPIDHTALSVEEYVQQYTNGMGFDAVLDTVGGSVLDNSFKAVKRYTGHVASILGWGIHSLAPLSFLNGSYSGVFTLYPLLSGENKKHHGKIVQEAAKLMEEGKIKVMLHNKTFSLEQVNEAYQVLDNKKSSGKIVITLD